MRKWWRTAGAVGGAGAGASAAAVAIAASACCASPAIAPLVVGVFGAGGAAWAAGLRPYSPYLLVLSGVMIAYALRSVSVLRRPDRCGPGDSADQAPRLWTRTIARVVAWSAALLWLAALALNLTLG